MLTYLKSTMRVQRILMHLSSGHVTLLIGKIHLRTIFFQSDLGRRADSRCALPQISSFVWFSYFSFSRLFVLLSQMNNQ